MTGFNLRDIFQLSFFLYFYMIEIFFSLWIFDRTLFKNELTLLEKVRHPNLVQFVGAVTQRQPMMIVSEYHRGVSHLFLSSLV